MMITFQIITALAFIYFRVSAFIFTQDYRDRGTLMNHEYDDKCLRNDTVMKKVDHLALSLIKIKSFSRKEQRFISRLGFRTANTEICESKRDIARTMTPSIQPIADYCIKEEKIRKQIVLNTLLLLETTLDFVCSINQDIYEGIYERHSEQCISDNMQLLKQCQRKSFDLYFWEKIPTKITLIQLINGSVCNFKFDKMLNCSKDAFSSSCQSAADLLAYQFDIIKKQSLCYKIKNVSEIIDSSSDEIAS